MHLKNASPIFGINSINNRSSYSEKWQASNTGIRS